MRAKEPWQSRSPTGARNTFVNPDTLNEQGRKGPQHSYGRGLPVKRKALIILSIAILAFAMIPALGAGAASGAIKIVTPDQLANPSGTTGSAFDKLSGAKYVSTALDADDAGLEGTSSTLHIVIDDDDKEANALGTYYAFYTNDPTTIGAFNVRSANSDSDNIVTGGTTPQLIANSAGYLLDASGLDERSPATPNNLDGDEAEGLIIGNRSREGAVDGADITVEVGYYYIVTPTATPAANATKLTNVQRDKINFTSQTTYTTQYIAMSKLDEDIVAVQLRGNEIDFLDPPSPPQGATYTYTQAMRISFASASENDLNYTSGTNAGQSRVEVSSTSGDRIRVEAKETDIAGLASSEAVGNGIDAKELATEPSKDSGTFVGIIGVLDYDWKRMLETWVTDDQGNDRVVMDKTSITYELIADDNDDTTDSPRVDTSTGRTVIEGDPDAGTLILPAIAAPANSYVITGTPELAASLPVTPNTTAGQPDLRPANSVDVTSAWVATTRVMTVTVTDKVATPDVAPANLIALGDTFTVTYQTVASVDTLQAALDEAPASRHEAFENLVDRDGKDHALALKDALTNHTARLDLSGASHASALSNALIGVRHGDSISVQYADASGGTSTNNTRVDIVKPSIGGLNPANGAFTTDPTFDMLFEITDADSGVKEDADTKTVGKRSVKDLSATMSARFANGQSTGTTYTVTPDEEDEVSDGYLYEMRIDAGQDSLDAEKLTPPQNLRVMITIVAYDIARNRQQLEITYEIDTIDPDLTGAIMGWSVKSVASVLRTNASDKGHPVTGAHVLVENQKNSMVLIFNGPIDGNSIRPSDIAVGTGSIETVTWLNKKGDNVISVGTLTADTGSATDMDFNAKTATSSNARDDVGDANTGQPAGMGLSANRNGQDARHLLFVTFASEVATDARPAVGLDRDDVSDLAGNKNRSDHSVAKATDRVAPRFTINIDPKLSNDTLSATIDASEGLDRPPTVKVGTRSVTARPASGGGWTISESISSLGFGKATAAQDRNDGFHTISVTGIDEDDNEGTAASVKWELDTRANKGNPPTRGGAPTDKAVTQKIEVNDVVFLNVSFKDEGNEYDDDSAKKIAISALALETLSADSIHTSGPNKDKIKAEASVTVEATTNLDAATAQSRDGVTHVVALSDLAIGDYRLTFDFADDAGNTGKFGYVFRIIAPLPAEIGLVPGWSLVSIPGTPQDLSISGVLEGTSVTDVWSLNNESKVWEFARVDEEGEWTGTLVQIVDGRAYFVRSTTFDPIKVLTERFSPQRTPAQYTVTAGWNGIGYTPAGDEEHISVDGYLSSLGASGWGMIRTWNAEATPPQYETYFSSGAATEDFPKDKTGVAVVEEGKGYLLFATRNGVIGG